MKGGNCKMGCCYAMNGNCSSGSARSFLTKEEKIEMLRDYKQELESEAKGVGERIAELEKSD